MNGNQIVSKEYSKDKSGVLDNLIARGNTRNVLGEIAEAARQMESIYQGLEAQQKELDIKTASFNKNLAEYKRIQGQIEKDIKSKSFDSSKVLEETINLRKTEKKLIEDIIVAKMKSGEITDDEIDTLNTIESQLRRLKIAQDDIKEGSKTMLQSFTESVGKLRTELKDLALIKGLDDITKTLTSSDNTSLLSVRNRTTTQLGITDASFNKFKNDLLGRIDNFRYNWKDTATYLNNLDKLGITNVEMAEQQYLAIMQGTKYLGQSVDTQAAILKNARQTGNINLLAETNQNMVKIMNAQLGVSKEQLDKLTQQAASLGSLTALAGVDSTATNQLQLAAITSKYGEGAATALSNIASQMLTGNTTYAAYLGSNYQSIMEQLQSGNSNALLNLYEALQGSTYLQAQSKNPYIRGDIGNDLLTIASAGSQTGESLTSLMKKETEASGDMNSYIENIQVTFKEMVDNFTSNIAAKLPESLTLANAFYVAEGAYMLLQGARDLEKINLLSTIAFNTSKTGEIAEAVGGKGEGTGGSSILSGIKKIGTSGVFRAIEGIGGAVMAISDGIKAQQEIDKYGGSGLKAFFGGTLAGSADGGIVNGFKNAFKWAMIGGAIVPGWGHLFGGLLGLVLGTMGGSAITSSNPLDRVGAVAGGLAGGVPGMLLGAMAQNSTKAEGDSPDGVTGTNAASTPNYNATSSWPWRISSNWGPRTPLTTTKGTKTSKFHGGTDFAIRTGTGLGANHGGTVAATGYHSSLGNYVTIKGDHGLYERYQHLNNRNPLVSVGQRVEQGQLIGYSGATGDVTGPHLHFQEQKTLGGTPKDQNTVDARPYITAGLFAQSGNYNPMSFVPYTGENTQADTEGAMVYGRLLQNIIDANTLETQAANGAMGDDGVKTSVDSGFDRLIEKIDSLSNKQDAQEEMLKAISAGTSNALYRF